MSPIWGHGRRRKKWDPGLLFDLHDCVSKGRRDELSFYCRVFVDGELVGEHVAGGYVAFFLDVPAPSSTGPRKLFVLADNRFNKTTAPMQ